MMTIKINVYGYYSLIVKKARMWLKSMKKYGIKLYILLAWKNNVKSISDNSGYIKIKINSNADFRTTKVFQNILFISTTFLFF